MTQVTATAFYKDLLRLLELIYAKNGSINFIKPSYINSIEQGPEKMDDQLFIVDYWIPDDK